MRVCEYPPGMRIANHGRARRSRRHTLFAVFKETQMTDHSRDQQADDTARRQRELQHEQDQRDAWRSPSGTPDNAAQPGDRHQPEPPQPGQHLQKPGRESDLDPAPRYTAPEYRGSGKLQGKVALITGGDSGIGRAVAVLYA